jgi:NAD(P)H-quinone oxidoreductase subunit 5
VFLGDPHPKTLRAPEANWLMALPMVSLTVMVGLTPLAMARFTSLSWHHRLLPWHNGMADLSAACGGILAGADPSGSALVPADPLLAAHCAPCRTCWPRISTPSGFIATPSWLFVSNLARLTDSFDQLVVMGLVNRIGLGSMAGAESLRFWVSGQLQSYVFTVVVAIVLLFTTLSWVFL